MCCVFYQMQSGMLEMERCLSYSAAQWCSALRIIMFHWLSPPWIHQMWLCIFRSRNDMPVSMQRTAATPSNKHYIVCLWSIMCFKGQGRWYSCQQQWIDPFDCPKTNKNTSMNYNVGLGDMFHHCNEYSQPSTHYSGAANTHQSANLC